jgi:hypothetical protein
MAESFQQQLADRMAAALGTVQQVAQQTGQTEQQVVAGMTVTPTPGSGGGDLGRAFGDLTRGDFSGAASETGAVAGSAFQSAESGLQHLGSTLTNAVADAVNGVKGALASLVSLAKGMNPSDLVKLVGGELADVQKGLDATMARAFPTVTVPTDGKGLNGFFPANVRGAIFRWVDVRNNPADLVWYLAALALIDADKLKAEVGKDLGIKIP